MARIVFILPVKSSPRYTKRINEYTKKGYEITVLYFERSHLVDKKTSDKYSLGVIQDRDYIKRIPVLLASIFKVIKYVRKSDLFYIFSLDTLLIHGIFFKKKKIIYEVGDIREISNGIVSKAIDFCYNYFLKRVQKIVLTSDGYVDYFVNKFSLERKRFHLIENKLSKALLTNKNFRFKEISTAFTIGIIGNFRYENILYFLDAFSKSELNHFKIALYGGGLLMDKINGYIDDEKVTYKGRFKSPEDLEAIYSKVDLSFVMYDVNSLNVRLALPNKLYESMMYKKPLIASEGTYLAEKTRNYDVGFVWKQNDMSGLIDYLNSPKFLSDYNRMKSSFQLIRQEEYSF